jgi:hypothetical protein
MRVLIISLFTGWETHLGTELELARRHLDAGDEVEFLSCDGCIRTCMVNPKGRISRCDACRLRRSRGLALLGAPVPEHRLGDYLPAEELAAAESAIKRQVTDLASAESFEVDGMDLGAGGASSAIFRVRDPSLESDRGRDALLAYVRGAARSYLAVRSFLARHAGRFQRAYVFNGRFGCTRGAFRACQAVPGLEVFTHERGASIQRYSLYPNCLPHSRSHWESQARRTWQEADPVEREKLGRMFYEERRKGVGVSWKSFTAGQQAGLLPPGFDPARRNIVIFNSSEDEFVGLGPEWKNPVYPSQSEGIARVVTDGLARYPEAHFYLRMHPNLTGVQNRDVAAVRALAARGLPNFTLVEADSKVSSYQLLEVAERVLTFGSTMGAEAAYWGKVSIQAGHSFYEGLGSTYVAADHAEVMDLLGAAVAPKPPLGALQYGHIARTHGTQFMHWQAETLFKGAFRGQALEVRPKGKLSRRLVMWARDWSARRRRLETA